MALNCTLVDIVSMFYTSVQGIYFYQVIFGTKFKFSENQSTLRLHNSYWAPSILLRSRHYGNGVLSKSKSNECATYFCKSAKLFLSVFVTYFLLFLKNAQCIWSYNRMQKYTSLKRPPHSSCHRAFISKKPLENTCKVTFEAIALGCRMCGPFWSVWCKMALAEVGVSLPKLCPVPVVLAPGTEAFF